MAPSVVNLAKELIAIPSCSDQSNGAVSDRLEAWLQQWGFEVERLTYRDDKGETKVNLVARKGSGSGGLGFFSHSDTVPGDEGWQPFQPQIAGGRLVGRGSCDMKGPLAATLAATADVDGAALKHPLWIVVTADEEIGYGGARQMIAESQLLQDTWPQYGVVAEPTRLEPVHAHKGGMRVVAVAHGRAAHTSTDQGVSANFLIAPFLAEMAELVPLFRREERFLNRMFEPPTNGFNMVIDDGGCKPNVTAAKTVCTLALRLMPDDAHQEALERIVTKAEKYDLDVTWTMIPPFYTAPETPIVQAAVQASGAPKAVTVPFGTEAALYKDHLQAVILGPGDIAQAHTVGEWIDLDQLTAAVDVYRRLVEHFCL